MIKDRLFEKLIEESNAIHHNQPRVAKKINEWVAQVNSHQGISITFPQNMTDIRCVTTRELFENIKECLMDVIEE